MPTFDSNKKLVSTFSIIVICSVIYGLLAAHIPFMIGTPWVTCSNCSSRLNCELVFHLFGAPMVLYNIYISWYGLRIFSPATVNQYVSMLASVFTVNLIYFAFECQLMLTNIRNDAPAWENLVLATVAIMLLLGSFLALYVKQKLITQS